MHMKHRILLLWCLWITAVACHDDPNSNFTNLALSTNALNIVPDGGTLKFAITCNSNWQISGSDSWCVPDKTSGSGNANINLTVSAYDNTEQNRQTTLTVSSGTQSQTLTVTQYASLADYHYELPVIFHILRGPSDRKTVQQAWLSEIINACNTNYQGLAGDTPDINLSFVLADKKPDGTSLSEPGINYVDWSTSTIDPDVFMDDESPDPKAVALLWDPNSYINVFIYYFNTTNNNTTGISFLPYCTSSNRLDGLYDGDYYFDQSPNYVHCVSLNRTYLYNRSTATTHDPADVVITLSHELGHYLGLFHVFSETQCGENDDYCSDTPDYNRSSYESWLSRTLTSKPNVTMEDLTQRTSCNGTSFIAHNFMDYYYTYGDQFTEEQLQRIRYVLSYSPLIPGPKYDRPESKGKEYPVPPARKMP